MKISRHFSLEEVTRSQVATRKGINNTLPDELMGDVVDVAQALDRIRDYLNVPIHVTSWYRCPKLNSAIGGAKASKHMEGLAVDFEAPDYGTPEEVAKAIIESGLDFDRMILEYPPDGWVHIEPVGSRKIFMTVDK